MFLTRRPTEKVGYCEREFMLIPPSFTSCPPCGSEFLLRGGDKNLSKSISQGGQEVKEGKFRSVASISYVRRVCLLSAWIRQSDLTLALTAVGSESSLLTIFPSHILPKSPFFGGADSK